MPISHTTAVLLSDILRAYHSESTLFEIARWFSDVDLGDWGQFDPPWLEISGRLIRRIEFGDNRPYVEALLAYADRRCSEALRYPDQWDARGYDYHDELAGAIATVKEALGEPAIPPELTVEAGKEFTAKSEVREFFAKAEDSLLLVDPYVGVGTLDCLRDVKVPMRILTGEHAQSVEAKFENNVAAFRAEGYSVEIRQHPGLHDRLALFNGRCWLIGSSLKDAGRKDFHCIEIHEARDAVVEALERKWNEAKPFRI